MTLAVKGYHFQIMTQRLLEGRINGLRLFLWCNWNFMISRTNHREAMAMCLCMCRRRVGVCGKVRCASSDEIGFQTAHGPQGTVGRFHCSWDCSSNNQRK